MMKMYFHWGTREMILFKTWDTTNEGSYWLAIFLVFFTGILIEYFHQWRDRLQKRISRSSNRNNNSELESPLNESALRPSIHPLAARLIRSGLYIVQFAASYILMLLVMTYNAGIFFAVILGAGVGHFLFRSGESGTGTTMACHPD